MAEKDKDNKEGKNPSGVLETIGDLNDFIKGGSLKQAGASIGQAAQDILKKKEEGKD